jgi:hypothetical protein
MNRLLLCRLSVFNLCLFSTLSLQAADGVKSAALTTLPLAAQPKISATLGRNNPSYFLHSGSGGLNAGNAAQGLDVHFSVKSVDVRSSGANWQLSFRGYGYGDVVKETSAVVPQPGANRVEYRRGSLTEWYVNGPIGVEQGFTISERPGKVTGQPLTIALSVSGDWRTTTAGQRSLTLTGQDGQSKLQYAGLCAYDANGKDLQASMELRGNRLLLKVDDALARYPVVVDPWLQRARLTATDGGIDDQLGWSVAISGNTVVLGSPFWQTGRGQSPGAGYVFVKPASGWKNMTQTAKLTNSDGLQNGTFFGYAVAIEGDTIVVGALNLPLLGANREHTPQFTPDPGAYVFIKPKGGWKDMTETAKLTAFDPQADDYFACSVSVSGNTVVVGANQYGFNQATGPGKAYVYVKPARGWKSATENARLTASDGVLDDLNGNSVSISGNTVVSGAPNHGSRGAAYVFVKPARGWKNMTQTAELSVAKKNDSGGFGNAVTISGNTVVSGAWAVKFHQNAVGAAYVFVESASGWKNMTQTAKLTIPHFPFTFDFGYSVDLKGNMLAIGAPAWPYGTGVGSAYLFVKPSSGWKTTSRFAAKLVPSDSALDDRFGFSVAVDGSTIVSGATAAGGSHDSPGAGYVFTK